MSVVAWLTASRTEGRVAVTPRLNVPSSGVADALPLPTTVIVVVVVDAASATCVLTGVAAGALFGLNSKSAIAPEAIAIRTPTATM
jgi:hypothetical protein